MLLFSSLGLSWWNPPPSTRRYGERRPKAISVIAVIPSKHLESFRCGFFFHETGNQVRIKKRSWNEADLWKVHGGIALQQCDRNLVHPSGCDAGNSAGNSMWEWNWSTFLRVFLKLSSNYCNATPSSHFAVNKSAHFEAFDVETLKVNSKLLASYKVAYKSSSSREHTVNFRNHKFPFIDE